MARQQGAIVEVLGFDFWECSKKKPNWMFSHLLECAVDSGDDLIGLSIE